MPKFTLSLTTALLAFQISANLAATEPDEMFGPVIIPEEVEKCSAINHSCNPRPVDDTPIEKPTIQIKLEPAESPIDDVVTDPSRQQPGRPAPTVSDNEKLSKELIKHEIAEPSEDELTDPIIKDSDVREETPVRVKSSNRRAFSSQNTSRARSHVISSGAHSTQRFVRRKSSRLGADRSSYRRSRSR